MMLTEEHIEILREVLRHGATTTLDDVALATGNFDGTVYQMVRELVQAGMMLNIHEGKAREAAYLVTGAGLINLCLHNEITKAAATMARNHALSLGSLKLRQRSGLSMSTTIQAL